MPESATAFKVLLLYLVIINAVTYFLFAWDKRLSRRGGTRIRERDFIILSILGGSPGGLLGMYLLHHKTRHFKFKYGLPVIFVIQAVLLLYLAVH